MGLGAVRQLQALSHEVCWGWYRYRTSLQLAERVCYNQNKRDDTEGGERNNTGTGYSCNRVRRIDRDRH